MKLGRESVRHRRFWKVFEAPSEVFIVEFLVFASFFATMVVRMEINNAHAELDTSYLAGESESCTFSSSVISDHSADITIGNTVEDIGTTKITTKCANSLDHQIYAVGYTNDTEGNTNLVSSNNSTIPTGTGSGDVSDWAMKITKDNSSYLPANLTIDNGFNAYSSVPSSSAQIASYTGATDSSTGSAVFATYRVHSSSSQVAGDYTGTVKFTLTATMLYNVTIAPTAGISKVTLNGTECTDATNGCTVSNLTAGQSYSLSATVADGFTFARWNPGPNGTVASPTSATTAFTVGDGSSVITPTAIMDQNTLQIQYDAGVSSIAVNGTTVANNGTVSLTYGTPYIVAPTLNPGYELSNYTFTPYNVASSKIVANSSFAGPNMQNLDESTCTTTPSLAKDTRDGHVYTIQRLADGNCWMMENLDLGRTAITTDLTSSNTNLDISATAISASDFNSWVKTSGTKSYTAAELIPVSGTDSTSNTPYGTLYNYCAASAGTICTSANDKDATSDLCPAGWRLPTGGNSGEFQALYNLTDYNTYAKMRAPIANGGAAFALAGYFYDSTPTGQGSGANYWSSTRFNVDEMYRLTIGISNVEPADFYLRYFGWSIRCILNETLTISDLTYMQDFKDLSANDKAFVLASMEDSTTYSLIDNRDNKTYQIAKLKDDNIWMVENLDLGRTALTANLTNTNTNLDTNTTISATTFNSWVKSSGSRSYTSAELIPLTTSNTSNGLDTDATSNTPYGTLYNYCAASAGTICSANGANNNNATNDLCPAGWRLPMGGDSGEFKALYDLTDYNTYAKMRAPIADGGVAFALAGEFTNSSPRHQGSYGNYWTSTRYDGTEMYELYINSSYPDTTYYFSRDEGYSVRCIANI